MILLSTPHGVADLRNFQFYLNPRGYGWADTDNCDCPPCCYNVSADIDGPLSLRIIESLLQARGYLYICYRQEGLFIFATGKRVSLYLLLHDELVTSVNRISQ